MEREPRLGALGVLKEIWDKGDPDLDRLVADFFRHAKSRKGAVGAGILTGWGAVNESIPLAVTFATAMILIKAFDKGPRSIEKVLEEKIKERKTNTVRR